jgi:hypothetical protein
VSYVEFPFDLIVAIHGKTKPDPTDPNEPPSDYKLTCGAFDNGVAAGFVNAGAFLILDTYNLYSRIVDGNPGHAPDKPYMYFPNFKYSQAVGVTAYQPYVWWRPNSWTITYNGESPSGGRLKEFRNINIQVFNGTNAEPDQTAMGTIEIDNVHFPEIYQPLFICETFDPFVGDWVAEANPHVLIQAHCCPPGFSECAGYETSGTLPPQPPGWGIFFDPEVFTQYPAPGSTSEPIKPLPI